jgi:PAS domain S-box-containing protein
MRLRSIEEARPAPRAVASAHETAGQPTPSGAAAFIFQGELNRYVNPAAEVMTGYSADELCRMTFWDVIHPDYRDLVRQRGLARQRGEPTPWQYEVQLLRKDGTSLWVEFSGGLIDFDGQPAVLGTAVDITERRAAAEQLLEKDRRLHALIEGGSDVILIADANLQLRYVSPTMEDILGFRPEEMLDSDNLDRIHPDDVETVRGAYAELMVAPSRRAAATYRIRHRDGTWRWFESIGRNLLDDPIIRGVIINSRDVTDRVEAQSAYRTLVEHSLQGLLIVQDDRIVFANPVIAEITGYSADELVQLNDPEVRALFESHNQPLWGHSRSEQPRRTERRFTRRDGSERWIETYASPMEYRGRSATQLVFLDITDRKRAEEEARTHQQELAHVLRRRTMGEMAAVFAHEVNQPLTAILNYAKGCTHRLRSGSGHADALLAALDEIAAQALRAGEIIRRLRSFIQKSELVRQRRQLNDIVHEALQFVANEARERQVDLHVVLASDLPIVEIDPVQIEQVILNLLRNALEAIYEAPGARPFLSVRTQLAGDRIEFAVSDTGGGLAPQIADDVFEPFVTSKPEGLGMGLSICRSIVDAHGGRVWGTPNPERGMTFRFTLPVPRLPTST